MHTRSGWICYDKYYVFYRWDYNVFYMIYPINQSNRFLVCLLPAQPDTGLMSCCSSEQQ